MSTPPRPVVLYDEDCRFCRFAARAVLRLDRQEELAILPLHDPQAAPFLDRLPVAERFSSWRLARPNGPVVGFGSGSADLLDAMRLTRPLGSVFARVPTHVLDRVYALVAKHRTRLGRLVPNVAPVRRFP